MPPLAAMPVLRLTEDEDRVSRFDDAAVPLVPVAFAPPAPPIPVSATEAPTGLLYLVLPAGFLPIRVDPAIRETVLFKLLFNTCMNPTGALTGLTYGELVTHPATRGLIERLAEETLEVLAAEHDYRPAESGVAYVRDTLTRIVVPRSVGHRSSMLQDIAAGRRTEIDSLNGAVARLGRNNGIATPSHDALIDLIGARSPG